MITVVWPGFSTTAPVPREGLLQNLKKINCVRSNVKIYMQTNSNAIFLQLMEIVIKTLDIDNFS